MGSIWQTVVSSVERLSTARPGYILAALSLYIVSLFIVGARWRGFLRALGGDVGVTRAALATLGGISVGNLTPSSRVAGEACRIALVRLTGRATWREVAVAALWDRFSQLPALAVLAVMALLAVRRLPVTWRTGAIAVGVPIALIVAAVAVRKLRASGVGLAGWRERLALDRVTGRVFAAGVGYSALLWFQDVLRLSCAAAAFGVTLSPTKMATLSVLGILGSLVPTVGGLGAIEGGLVAGLVAFGVDLPTAAAITAAERLISYGFSTTAGAVVIALLGGRSLWTASRSRRVSADPLLP